MDAPFRVGDRVRLKPSSPRRKRMKFPEGVVVGIERCGGIAWIMRVRREVASVNPAQVWLWDGHSPDWEVVPLCDWTADQTLRALAQAVLDGDASAWRPLTDRALEVLSEMPQESGK